MNNKNRLAKSAIMVSGITIITLVFSFVKEAIFANYYGASSSTDAYSVAIQIPVTLFAMVSMAISNVALPYYSKKLNNDGHEVAEKYVSNLMTVISILTATIVILLEFFPGIVINIFAPGMSDEVHKMAVLLFRLVIPTIVLTELININTAIMDVNKSFILPQFGSIILNFIFVSLVIFLAKEWGIYAAVTGTIIGTTVEFIYSVLLRRKYVKYRLVCDVSDQDMIVSIKTSGPVFVGIGIEEINKTIDTMISSFLEPGAISMMGYASKLTSAISSLLVGGIVKVTYPEYAECSAKQDTIGMADCLLFAIRIVLLLLTPVVFGGIFLSEEIVSAVFYRGAFGMSAIIGTAPIFCAYITCLIFRALRQNLSRVFYSYGDTKTPMKNGFAGLIINTVLDIVLYKKYGAAGIAWATTGTYVIVSILLAFNIKKKNHNIHYRELTPLFFRVMISSCGMVAFISFVRLICINYGFYNLTNKANNIVFLIIAVFAGAVIYFSILLLLKTNEVVAAVETVFRRKK